MEPFSCARQVHRLILVTVLPLSLKSQAETLAGQGHQGS